MPKFKIVIETEEASQEAVEILAARLLRLALGSVRIASSSLSMRESRWLLLAEPIMGEGQLNQYRQGS